MPTLIVLALYAPAAFAKLGRPALALGMRGPEVSVLQRDLTEVGIKTKVTGRFNRGTRAHVKTFQREHHLAVDGVVGPQTARALLAAIRAGAASKSGGAKSSDNSSDTTDQAGCTPGATSGSSGGSSDGGTGLPTQAPACAPPVKLTIDKTTGLVEIPTTAPPVIQDVLEAANTIAWDKYVYGGGHNGWGKQPGYDCSGSTSYVLHAAGLMVKDQGDKWDEPFDSTQFEKYGAKGVGNWITMWTNAGHVYMKISNLYFDTAAQLETATGKKGPHRYGDRWSATRISPTKGFKVVHPIGW